MARSYILPLREAIVAHLKDDTNVTTEVDASYIFGMRSPSKVWDDTAKFVRCGPPDERQRGSSADLDISLHAFVKATFDDECAVIVDKLTASLDGRVLTLDGGEKAHLNARTSTVMADSAEADAWHGIARFAARVEICG